MHPNVLEQLRIFREVVGAGSFTAAANNLGKAVSAVSYAIANLEAQFQLRLFDRSGYRPELTEAGRTLYQDALIVFRRLERMQARIDGIKEEDAPRLTIAHDLQAPTSILAAALEALKQEYPHIDVHLTTARSADLTEALQRADLVFGALLDTAGYEGIDGREVGAIDAIMVCAPTHPLTRLNEMQLADLEEHTQLVLIDALPSPGGETMAIHTTDYWSADRLDMFIAMLRQGGLWGWALREQVEEHLARGELVELTTPSVRTANRRFAVAWPVKKPGGAGVRRFIELLAEAFAEREAGGPARGVFAEP